MRQSLNRKLLLISTITLVVIVLLTVIVASNVWALRSVAEHVQQHTQQGELSGRFDTHLVRAAGEAATFGGTGDEAYLEEALEALKQAELVLDQLEELTIASPDRAEHEVFLQREEALFARVQEGVQSIVAAREANDAAAISRAIETSFDYEEDAEALRAEMKFHFEAIAVDADTRVSVRRLLFVMFGAVGLLVLLVLLLAQLVREQIVKPINRLAAAATAIAQGSNETVLVTKQDEIGELQQALNNMLSQLRDLLAQRDLALEESLRDKQAAEAASRAKSSFLANMSHELRTPLNAIIGYAEILLLGISGPLSEEGQEDIQAIRDNGRHLLNLITEILELAKIEAGRVVLDKEAINVTAVLHELIKNNVDLLDAKPVTLTVEVDEKLPTLWADSVRLNQILSNLLSNAIKFTQQGTIVVRAYPTQGQMIFEVADTGIGISKADLPLIFREFEQVDGSQTRRAQGSGLGLAIVRHLVQMHGGELMVASELGKGSTFTVILPLGEAQVREPQPVL